jgi:hypothetical protein
MTKDKLNTLKELDIVVYVMEDEHYKSDHVFGSDKTDDEVICWAKKIHGDETVVIAIIR